MKKREIDQLATDYVRETLDGRGGDSDAVDRLQNLVWYDPESAWEVALRILQIADNENAAAIVGAGVLEELLGSYPEQFLPRTAKVAGEYPGVERAMKYVDIRSDEIPPDYFEQYLQLRSKTHK